MTMQFAPHVRHVRDQQQSEREYAAYEMALRRLEESLGMELPLIPREEYEDMRDLLAARTAGDPEPPC